MSVFSKNSQKKLVDASKSATVIASGTKIIGDITLSSSLHVDGEVEGIIHSDNVVTIGANGKVNGEIIAEDLVINGALTGSVKSNTIEILSEGHVKGKLSYNELTIEKGAVFEGETSVRSSVVIDNNVTESKLSNSNTLKFDDDLDLNDNLSLDDSLDESLALNL